MEAYKCDKCGTFRIPNLQEKQTTISAYCTPGELNEFDDFVAVQIDLCPGCADEETLRIHEIAKTRPKKIKS